ncbi:MAG: D-3-phosphoglycerate dehydrogenase, partial [uncultured Thermomicrobiales bacterium]
EGWHRDHGDAPIDARRDVGGAAPPRSAAVGVSRPRSPAVRLAPRDGGLGRRRCRRALVSRAGMAGVGAWAPVDPRGRSRGRRAPACGDPATRCDPDEQQRRPRAEHPRARARAAARLRPPLAAALVGPAGPSVARYRDARGSVRGFRADAPAGRHGRHRPGDGRAGRGVGDGGDRLPPPFRPADAGVRHSGVLAGGAARGTWQRRPRPRQPAADTSDPGIDRRRGAGGDAPRGVPLQRGPRSGGGPGGARSGARRRPPRRGGPRRDRPRTAATGVAPVGDGERDHHRPHVRSLAALLGPGHRAGGRERPAVSGGRGVGEQGRPRRWLL